MEEFRAYLVENGNAKSSIKEHVLNVKNFKVWCKNQNMLDIEQLGYSDILGYVNDLKKLTSQTVNVYLNSLTKYYDYLLEADLRQDNPVRRLRVKTPKIKVMPDLLKDEELNDLFNDFKSKTEFREQKHRLIHQRNVLILSLIIYQGVDVTTLKRLRITDLDFEKGTIFLPGTKRSNDRELKLKASQIIPFHSYVLQSRLELNPIEDELFNCHMSNTLSYILQSLKKQNPSIRNINQIRASVISGWLKRTDLRKTQYMAGHRYISSTEKYQQHDIEHLQESLAKFHPLG